MSIFIFLINFSTRQGTSTIVEAVKFPKTFAKSLLIAPVSRRVLFLFYSNQFQHSSKTSAIVVELSGQISEDICKSPPDSARFPTGAFSFLLQPFQHSSKTSAIVVESSGQIPKNICKISRRFNRFYFNICSVL